MNINAHQTVYVVTPEMTSSSQLMFRDNIVPMIKGKHVLVLAVSVATGGTVRAAMEAVKYYGGEIEKPVKLLLEDKGRWEKRIQKAMELLRTTQLSISVIAAQTGYETQSKFAAAFKEAAGLSPSAYRKSNALGGK